MYLYNIVYIVRPIAAAEADDDKCLHLDNKNRIQTIRDGARHTRCDYYYRYTDGYELWYSCTAYTLLLPILCQMFALFRKLLRAFTPEYVNNTTRY